MYLGQFTPLARRRPSPHGQGTVTYEEYNARPGESVFPQDAPDPIRQGDVPCRQSRMPIALMSLDVTDWNSGFPDAFLPTYNKDKIPRFQQVGNQAQLNIRAQQAAGPRPNIARGTVAAYGSMFQLAPQTYDQSR